jgi:hypothetical protein
MDRRTLLRLAAAGTTALAGCVSSPSAPSSAPPPYETREVDDGPVYGPGLRDEGERAFHAALVTTEAEAAAFDLARFDRDADRAFVTSTDFRRWYLGVVQISGVSSSRSVWLVDVAASDATLGLVLGLEDPTPRSEDRVVTTYLVRVHREGRRPPEGIWVQLSIDDRTVTFEGT